MKRLRKHLWPTLLFPLAAAVVWWLAPPRPRATLPEGSHLIRLSPDGRLLATRRGGQVTLWDVATGREAGRLAGDLAGWPLWDFAFSADGRWLAASGEGILKLWEMPAGREHAEVRVSADRTFRAGPVFSPDGRWVAFRAATGDGARQEVRIWDVALGRERARLPGPWVEQLRFSSDSKTLAFESWEPVPQQPPRGVIRLWDTGTGQERPAFDQQPAPLRVLAFSPDGSKLATGERPRWQWDGQHEVKLWDRATGRAPDTWMVPRGVSGLRFTADGARLLVRLDTGFGLNADPLKSDLFIIDPDSPHENPVLVRCADSVSPRGEFMACVMGDAEFPSTIVELPALRERVELRQLPTDARSLPKGFSPDGRLFAVVGNATEPPPPSPAVDWLRGLLGLKPVPTPGRPDRQAELHLYETDTGRRQGIVPVMSGTVVWFTPDGTTLVAIGPDQSPVLWDLPPRKPWGRIAAWWVLLGAAFVAAGSWPRRRKKPGASHD